jgi:hypothetical protein
MPCLVHTIDPSICVWRGPPMLVPSRQHPSRTASFITRQPLRKLSVGTVVAFCSVFVVFGAGISRCCASTRLNPIRWISGAPIANTARNVRTPTRQFISTLNSLLANENDTFGILPQSTGQTPPAVVKSSQHWLCCSCAPETKGVNVTDKDTCRDDENDDR